MEPRSDRLQILDIARGLAAIAVVVYHASMQRSETIAAFEADPATASMNEVFIYVCRLGWIGVPIFFVISGYCIFSAAQRHKVQQRSATSFFKRRFWRIYPTYWLSLPVILAMTLLLLKQPPKALHLTQWLGNLFLFEEWRPYVMPPGSKQYLSHVAWTLCYEEQFYILTGLLLWLLPRCLIPTFIGLTLFSFYNNYNIFVGPLSSLSHWTEAKVDCSGLIADRYWLFFAAGMLVHRYRRVSPPSRVMIAGLLTLLLIYEIHQGDWWTNRYASRVAAFGFSLWLCLIQGWDSKVCTLPGANALLWLGTRTYSIYLIHLPIVVSIVAMERFLGGNERWTLVITIPLSILLSIAAGAIFFHVFESRFLPQPSRSEK